MTVIKDNDGNEIEMITGVPAGTKTAPIAEGQKEFKSNPADFMKLLGQMGQKIDMPNIDKTGRVIANSDSGQKAMEDILTKFHNAGKRTVKRIVDDSEYDPVLREALVTEKTNDGIKIGEWEILANLNESTGKPISYSIKNVHTGSIIAEQLRSFDASKKLVKCLNRGSYINSKEVKAILSLEESYRRNYEDALMFRKRFRSCLKQGNKSKAEIYEARYQHSRALALRIKEEIKDLK